MAIRANYEKLRGNNRSIKAARPAEAAVFEVIWGANEWRFLRREYK